MSEYAFGSFYPPQEERRPQHVDLQVHDGVTFFSLNDHVNYILGASSFDSTSHQLRKHTATSSMFDGEFVIHATKSNVVEKIQVQVLGADQIMVGDNIDRLVEAFLQPQYVARKILGMDVEVWRCQPADYQIERGHINIHNKRAVLTLNVPRFPKVTREVME